MKKIIHLALKEDIPQKDITTEALIPPGKRSKAVIVTRQRCVVFGLEVTKEIFRQLDPSARFVTYCQEGEAVPKNSKIILIQGKTRAILTGERVALNFLSQLSGIATTTREFVLHVKPYPAKVMDTRKTTPGLRKLEKAAVKAAGGFNHRMNLSEMVLIKDNHKIACQDEMTLAEMIRQLRKKIEKKLIQIEVENLKEFKDALQGHPDMILLDNMSTRQIREAVQMMKRMKLKHAPEIEVSGGVNLKNIKAIAKTKVDRISIGELTHSNKAIDFSLELIH